VTKASSTPTPIGRPPHFLFPDPEVRAYLDRIAAAEEASEAETRAIEVAGLRQHLNVPEGGPELRAWLRWLLQRVPHKKTGRAYTQADIGREAGDASGATVSRVFQAELPGGGLSDAVRKVTAAVLQLPVDVIWLPAAVCAECGSPLHKGDPDTRGGHGRRAVQRSPSVELSRAANHKVGARQARRRSRTPRR
jgi:hypothetical protein